MSKLFSRVMLSVIAAGLVLGSTSLAQEGGAAAEGGGAPKGRRAVTNVGRYPRAGIPALVKLIRESQSPLVRKHAARTVERFGLEARFVADDLRKALKAEADETVKKALSEAIEAADPPVEKLDVNELVRRLHNTQEELAMRKAVVKALTDARFDVSRLYRLRIRQSLQDVLLDPAIQAEVADALETLEKRERAVLRDKNDVVIPKRGR